MADENAPKTVKVVVWGSVSLKGNDVEPGTEIEVTPQQQVMLQKGGYLTKPIKLKGA